MKLDLNLRAHRRIQAEIYRRQITATIRRQRGFIINPYALGAGTPTDPYFSNVISLLHFNGSDGSTTFTDQKGKTWTAGGAGVELDTGIKKYGSAALLTTNGKGLSTPDHTDWDFGSGDFCIEGWAYEVNQAASFAWIIFKGASGSYSPFGIAVQSDRGLYGFASFNGSSWGVTIDGGSANYADETWFHVAFTRSGNDFRLFANGTQVGSTVTASGALMTNSTVVSLGTNASLTAANSFVGSFDDVRVTKGVARYTSNFTAPTAEFPDS